MNRKYTLSITFLVIFLLAGCNNQIVKEQPPVEVPKKVVDLTNINKDDVAENINGYNLSDDERLTDIVHANILADFSKKLGAQVLTADETSGVTILEKYSSTLPEGISNNVQYKFYDLGFNYFLITNENGYGIKEKPSQNSAIIQNMNYLEKVSLVERVQGEEVESSNIWYRVLFLKGKELKTGYVHSSAGIARRFRYEEMQNAVIDLIQELSEGGLNFISNYKNYNGAPPNKNNDEVDEYGYRSFHSAPAYIEDSTSSEFRYIPDGILVRILDETDEFYHVYVPTFGSDFFVPKQYINKDEKLNRLTNVVVIDRKQQNQAAFEVVDNGLSLISYTLSTTGLPGQHSYETTLGSYKAIEKKDRFLYAQKGTDEIAGYAPFAIRFTGGAYIHGVPVEFLEQNGERIDPGNVEYLHTIGTFPRSSMCVRNYTSHAKFLYEWMDLENGAVIVIE